MDADALIDVVLEKARRAGAAAEVFYEASESRPAEFENNKLKYLATRSERGAGVRVIRNGRVGFSSTSDFGRLDELVENALESAAFGEEARFEFPAVCQAAEVSVFDAEVGEVSTRRIVEVGEEAIERVLSRHPEVQCSAAVAASVGEERVANSRGLDIGHRSSTFSMDLTALAVQDDGLVWVGDGWTNCRLRTDSTALTDKIISDLDLAREEAEISTGVYPAIFTANAMASLLISLSDGVNGKVVQKGVSPLGGRLGERIFDERITVWDDGVMDYAASSAPHDTEGLRSRRTALIERGVLKNFLFDLQTAGLMNAEPTGNGLRNSGSMPVPGHNNTVVAVGDTACEDMVRGIRRGLLVDHVMGGGMSNTLAGEFSVNLELGFLIEDGRPAGRVKNCMLFGNMYELLKDGVEAIGDTAEMRDSLSLPHFWFKGISAGR